MVNHISIFSVWGQVRVVILKIASWFRGIHKHVLWACSLNSVEYSTWTPRCLWVLLLERRLTDLHIGSHPLSLLLSFSLSPILCLSFSLLHTSKCVKPFKGYGILFKKLSSVKWSLLMMMHETKTTCSNILKQQALLSWVKVRVVHWHWKKVWETFYRVEILANARVLQ